MFFKGGFSLIENLFSAQKMFCRNILRGRNTIVSLSKGNSIYALVINLRQTYNIYSLTELTESWIKKLGWIDLTSSFQFYHVTESFWKKNRLYENFLKTLSKISHSSTGKRVKKSVWKSKSSFGLNLILKWSLLLNLFNLKNPKHISFNMKFLILILNL